MTKFEKAYIKYEKSIEPILHMKIAKFVSECKEKGIKETIDNFDMTSNKDKYWLCKIIERIKCLDKENYPNITFYMPKNKIMFPLDLEGEAYYTDEETHFTEYLCFPIQGKKLLIDDIELYECTSIEFDENFGIAINEDEIMNFFRNKHKKKQYTLSEKIKLERGNKCEMCGYAECNCDVHHINPKSKGGTNDKSNLIVLCPNCHRKEHEKLRRNK